MYDPDFGPAADFSTDPAEVQTDPAAAPPAEAQPANPDPMGDLHSAPYRGEPLGDGPQAPEPEAAPAVTEEAVEHYPEAAIDAPSRLRPAARPCPAGP